MTFNTLFCRSKSLGVVSFTQPTYWFIRKVICCCLGTRHGHSHERTPNVDPHISQALKSPDAKAIRAFIFSSKLRFFLEVIDKPIAISAIHSVGYHPRYRFCLMRYLWLFVCHRFGSLAQLIFLYFTCAGFRNFSKDNVFRYFKTGQILTAMLKYTSAL